MRHAFVALIAALALAACGGQSSSSASVAPSQPGGPTDPGQGTSYAAEAKALLQAQGCTDDLQDIVFGVQEGAAGGSIDQSGVYTTPACAPTVVLGTYHITVTDAACGVTVSIPVRVIDDVKSETLACQVLGGSNQCTPNPKPRPGQKVVDYWKTTYACGEVVYTPPLPVPPPSGVQ